MTALSIQARLFVDDKATGLLTITNALTGTESHPTYRVEMDFFKERRVVTTELKDVERDGTTRLDLLAAAFEAIAGLERGA